MKPNKAVKVIEELEKTGVHVRFHKLANQYGQVIAAYYPTSVDNLLQVGLAFCNPKDLTLARDTREHKARGIAVGRLQAKPIQVCVKDLSPREITAALVWNLKGRFVSGTLPVRPYNGAVHKSEFRQWLAVFLRVYEESLARSAKKT